MRKRRFTPSVEIMGLRLAPSGAIPMDFPDPTVQDTMDSGSSQTPLITSDDTNFLHTSIPPMFYPGVLSDTE